MKNNKIKLVIAGLIFLSIQIFFVYKGYYNISLIFCALSLFCCITSFIIDNKKD